MSEKLSIGKKHLEIYLDSDCFKQNMNCLIWDVKKMKTLVYER